MAGVQVHELNGKFAGKPKYSTWSWITYRISVST